MTNRKRCAGKNASGEPCGAPPIRDSAYCYFHDPELAEVRERARDLGHARQRRDASLAQIYGFSTLATTEGKNQLLDIAAHDTLALDNSVPRNRALAGMVQTSIKVDEYTEIKEDIAALKAAVFGRKAEPPSVYDERDELGDHFDLPGEKP
jgi:hypothetical protein